MDPFVEEKLSELGLERFIPVFEENEIDRETFLLLDDETMKELIKPVGPRLKLKKELQSLVKDEGSQNEGDTSGTTYFLDDNSLDSSSTARSSPVLNSQSVSSCSSPESTPGVLTQRSQSLPSTSQPSTPRSHSSSLGSPGLGGRPSPSPSAQKRARADFTIREIIGKLEDDELLAEMEAGLLSYKSRKRIVNTLVSHLIELHGKFPRTDVKLAMARALTSEFPQFENSDGEGYQAWFAPAIGGHDSSGFLENRLRNVRRRDSHKASKPPTVMVPKSPLVSTVDLDLPEDELADSDIAAMTTWLKFHTSPTQQVEEMMRKTCRARATLIRTENEKTVAEIIKEYPRLIDVPGMIEQDFRILFPTSSDSLFMKWPVTYESILTYADKQISWREILNFSGKLDTDEQKSNMTVHLLPLLFPPGMKRKDGKKGPKHASTEDACTSFIQVEKVGVNIPAFLEAVKKCQPFILAVGQLESPEQVFVVVERQTVDCGSLLKGLDICFKLFYILDMTYPWECINLWDFVQKFIYGLGAGKGRHKSVPSVSLLINFLTSAATEPSKE